jgi:hypothetical protein
MCAVVFSCLKHEKATELHYFPVWRYTWLVVTVTLFSGFGWDHEDSVPFDVAILTKSVSCINIGFAIRIHDANLAV